jgi:hypothetical protein
MEFGDSVSETKGHECEDSCAYPSDIIPRLRNYWDLLSVLPVTIINVVVIEAN